MSTNRKNDIMNAKEQLKHALKLTAGLGPGRPTDSELDAIIQDIHQTKNPTKADWIKTTHKYVPQSGKYSYAGEDLADLNYLLMQIQKTTTSVGQSASTGTQVKK